MLAPFATLTFLLVLWLASAVVAQILSHSKSRIAMALRGEEPVKVRTSLVIRSRPSRAQASLRQPMRAQPQLRAAA
jgi:hypothetical protein